MKDLSSLLAIWAAVLLACGLVASLVRHLGQPRVVGEMLAGILLGPTLFASFFPTWFQQVYSPEIRQQFYLLSQVGLALFMFIVGCELDFRIFRSGKSLRFSLVGIAVPFALGVLAAYLFQHDKSLFNPDLSFGLKALFLGAAFSITAFPMLARIIHERGMSQSRPGTMALSAGAFDDLIAWILLAFIIAAFQDNLSQGLVTLAGGAAFFFVTMLLLRPALARLVERRPDLPGSRAYAALVAFLFLLSIAWTEFVGIHVVFGAFLAGVALPRNSFTRSMAGLEVWVSALFLPLFFTYSGLNTDLSLLGSNSALGFTVAVIALACLGKGLACGLAARWEGLSKADSLRMAAMMNARGLMELILLNLALQHELITLRTYAALALMAVVTTAMANPLFRMADRWERV